VILDFGLPGGDIPRMITITDRAALEAVRILGEQGKPTAMVRVWIAGVGCSGYQYGLGIDEKEPAEGDQVFENGGIRLIVDPESFTRLDGATLTWVDDADNRGFSIENPNPAPECGASCCGEEHAHEGECGDGCGDGGCCG
jgi:iron-sulfur cluster assembly accessory protein